MKTVTTLLAALVIGATAVACGTQKTAQMNNKPEKPEETQIEKLEETQIEKFVTSLERPDYSFREALFMEAPDYFISKMPLLSLDQLEGFLKIVEGMDKKNNRLFQMKDQVDASMIGGFEAAVAKYSSKPDEVMKNIQERIDCSQKLALLKSALSSTIEKKRDQVFKVPEGDLVYYEDRTFGGMLPSTTYRLEKKTDGKTYLTSTLGWRGDTTIVVPDAILTHVQKLFIEGKGYEVAPLYMTPFRIYDAPSWSLEARFSSGERISSDGRQSHTDIQAIWDIQKYLKEIAPKPKPTDY